MVLGFFLFLSIFFLNVWHNEVAHFPHLHPEENPSKVFYGNTAEIEDTAPRSVPIGVQCL